jgi:hypothetical protein
MEVNVRVECARARTRKAHTHTNTHQQNKQTNKQFLNALHSQDKGSPSERPLPFGSNQQRKRLDVPNAGPMPTLIIPEDTPPPRSTSHPGTRDLSVSLRELDISWDVASNRDTTFGVPGQLKDAVADYDIGSPSKMPAMTSFRDMIFADREAEPLETHVRKPGPRTISLSGDVRSPGTPGTDGKSDMPWGSSDLSGRVGNSPVVLRSADVPLCTDSEGRVVYARSSPAPSGPGK